MNDTGLLLESRRRAWRRLALLSGLGWMVMGARANGIDFFSQAHEAEHAHSLYYFGRVAEVSGKLVGPDTLIVLTLKGVPGALQFRPDYPGHYQSPDIAAWAAAAGAKIDPAAMPALVGIELRRPGWALARKPLVPARLQGVYKVDLLLAPAKD